MDRFRAWLLSVVVGIAVGSGTFVWLVDDRSLAIALVVVYTVGTQLFVEYAAELPGEVRGDEWQTTRWSVGFVALTMVAALFGVGTTLSVSNELCVALQLLVLGVGWTGLLFGVATTRAQVASESFEEAPPEDRAEHDPA